MIESEWANAPKNQFCAIRSVLALNGFYCSKGTASNDDGPLQDMLTRPETVELTFTVKNNVSKRDMP